MYIGPDSKLGLKLLGLSTSLQKHGHPENIVNKIDDDLKENYNYSEMETDALRHYLGMQALAERYGEDWADTFGHLHEFKGKAGWSIVDIFGGGWENLPEYKAKSEVDYINNAKALKDYSEGKIIKKYDKSILDSLLKEITIPPLPKYIEEFR
jgi:hypothetical protein